MSSRLTNQIRGKTSDYSQFPNAPYSSPSYSKYDSQGQKSSYKCVNQHVSHRIMKPSSCPWSQTFSADCLHSAVCKISARGTKRGCIKSKRFQSRVHPSSRKHRRDKITPSTTPGPETFVFEAVYAVDSIDDTWDASSVI